MTKNIITVLTIDMIRRSNPDLCLIPELDTLCCNGEVAVTARVVGIALGGNVEVAWTLGVIGMALGGNVEVEWMVGVVITALGGNVEVALTVGVGNIDELAVGVVAVVLLISVSPLSS